MGRVTVTSCGQRHVWAWAVVLAVVAGVGEGDHTYRRNWCHCDLDKCLYSVRTAVLEDKTVPKCTPEKDKFPVEKPGSSSDSANPADSAGDNSATDNGNDSNGTDSDATDAATDNSTDSDSSPAAGSNATDAGTDDATDAGTENGTDSGTDDGTDSGTDSTPDPGDNTGSPTDSGGGGNPTGSNTETTTGTGSSDADTENNAASTTQSSDSGGSATTTTASSSDSASDSSVTTTGAPTTPPAKIQPPGGNNTVTPATTTNSTEGNTTVTTTVGPAVRRRREAPDFRLPDPRAQPASPRRSRRRVPDEGSKVLIKGPAFERDGVRLYLSSVVDEVSGDVEGDDDDGVDPEGDEGVNPEGDEGVDPEGDEGVDPVGDDDGEVDPEGGDVDTSLNRKRRAVEENEDEDEEEDSERVVVAEPFRTIYDTVRDTGLVYLTASNISECSCEDGSVVKMELCLLDLKFDDDLNTANTRLYRNTTLDIIRHVQRFLSDLKDADKFHVFRRLSDVTFTERADGFSTFGATVELASVIYSADYYVKSAVEVHTRMRRKISVFKTDPEECLTAQDVTPEKPVDRHPLHYLRFLCIPIAIGILIGVVFIICVGARDACKLPYC